MVPNEIYVILAHPWSWWLWIVDWIYLFDSVKSEYMVCLYCICTQMKLHIIWYGPRERTILKMENEICSSWLSKSYIFLAPQVFINHLIVHMKIFLRRETEENSSYVCRQRGRILCFYISMFDRAIFIFLKLPLQWDLKAIFWLYALRWTRGLT